MSTPEVKIDLRRDLVEIIRNYLVTIVGYDAASIERIEAERSDKEFALICAHYNAQRRIVTATPREIHSAKTFSVPPEHAAALNTIEQKIRNGDWIVPYLHRKIKCLDYDDLLLNDWGIHHLHLGTEVCADGFVNRTGPLLYVCFRDTIDFHMSGDTSAYFIDILGHQSFTAQTLIETMYENWPHILPSPINGRGTGKRLSDNDIGALRKGHVNYILEMKDGTLQSPPGGGITTAGTGNIDTMRTIHLLNWADEQQRRLLQDIPAIIERSADNPSGGKFGKIIDFRMECLGENTWILRDANSNYMHPLHSP